MAVSQTPAPVGELLRSWRRRRSLSQLELSLNAAVSSRHLSFLETGRARPSREMVLHLADELQVPLREPMRFSWRRDMRPSTPSARFTRRMATGRRAVDRFLRAHEPYPALVVDRQHTLLASNDASHCSPRESRPTFSSHRPTPCASRCTRAAWRRGR